MKNRNRFGFLTGFTLSCLLHLTLAMLYFYYDTQKEGLKSIVKEPLRLSLNMFAPEPKKEEIIEVKPKPEPKPKPKPKPKPEVVKVPIPQEIIEEQPQETEEVQETEETQEEIVQAQEQQLSSAASFIEDESYKLLIVAAIEKYKGYPSKAKRMHMEGLVTIKLKIDKNGNLIFVEVIDGSGYGILDSHTIRSVEKAAKDFPQLPRDMLFTVPISYKLDKDS
ncbi:MAG: TonB family protein [Campylobacteraceae bacterium]|jgi:protein TonB|nr:TonB family protein [Campylobacteraceae bacterium]